MQFHVPFGYVSPPASAAATHSSGATPPSSPFHANALHARSFDTGSYPEAPPPSGQPGTSTGHAVGQGLLSGRRLAVRVTPHSAPVHPTHRETSPPQGDIRAAMTPHGFNPATASLMLYGDGGAGGQLHGDSSVLFKMSSAITAVSSPPLSSPSSRYGGGLVRISDLRKQGHSAVESGLRLNALQGGCPATTCNESDRPLADVFSPAATAAASIASTRRGPRASSTSVARATRGRGRGGGRRSSGRGRRPRGSVELELTEEGGLQDYRWFMARGRRCLMYNGQTYKGTAAHSMWTKMKQVKERRTSATQRAAAPSATRAAAAAAGAPPARMTARTAATNAAPRAHQTSARALSAAHRSLALENVGGAHQRTAASLPGGAPPLLRDGWQQMMDEVGIVHEEVPHFTLAAATAPSAHARDVRGPQETVEITDSSEDNFSTDATSSSLEGESTSDDESALSLGQRQKLQQEQLLQWPSTSYFSDASSGWSSASSLTSPRPPGQAEAAPAVKKAKTEGRASPLMPSAPSLTTASPSARVTMYNGVQVVEEDGWVYPVDVYASQHQQQQEDRAAPASQLLPPPASTRLPIRTTNTTTTTNAMLTRSDVLPDVGDVPLSDIFNQPPDRHLAAQSAATSSRMTPSVPSRAFLPPQPPRTPSGGLAVILGGKESATSLRPATSLDGHSNRRAGLTSSKSTTNPALREVSGDDVLDGFGDAELADMFVTGEEIGGVRYGA